MDRDTPAGILRAMETMTTFAMSDAALEAEVRADEARLLPSRPLDTKSDYEFALAALYLVEGLMYLAKGQTEDFFQMARVAGMTTDHATKKLGAEEKVKDLIARLPEVVVTLEDREVGLGLRPGGSNKPKAKKPTGPFRNVTDVSAESQPEARGAWRHFITLYLDCGHSVERTMYDSERFANGRDNTPKYARCDKCPAHFKSSPRAK